MSARGVTASAGSERCPREAEVLGGLGRGFLGLDLEAHLRDCEPCRELHLVAGALLTERAEAIAEAPVPSAGTMWWRMRLRHRQEAQATARRALLVGQALSLAVALALLLSLLGPGVLHGLRQLFADARLGALLLLAVVTLLVAVPIGGWLALRGK